MLLAGNVLFSTLAAASPVPDQVTLTWTQDPRTTQTITWRTDVSVGTGKVRYFYAPQAVPRMRFALAETELAPSSGTDMNLHSATLTGLTPGQRYSYEVGDGDSWSEPRSFVTAPLNPGKFSFLVFGDSQSVDYGVWRTTVQQAYQANPEAAFFTNVGDLVDVGQDYAEWEAWFAAASEVIDKIPAMPLTGNHESYTPERRFSVPAFFTAQFKLPGNGPEELRGQVYSFDYGDVHFVMLDSQEGEQRRFVPEMLEKQKSWLSENLAATNRKWKVVFIHRPIYGNKPNGINENIRQTFAPVFDQQQVDLVFTAHDHVLARTVPLFGDEAAQVPVRGTVYMATGRSGTKTYSNVSAKTWNDFFYNPQEEPNYLRVTVEGDTLTVEAFAQNGVLIDGWSLKK